MLCYNQGELTRRALSKFPQNRNYDVLVINDGSTDRTSEYIQEFDFKVINHSRNKGVGAGIKTGIKYASENKYQVIVVIAGNNKDDPREIPLLIEPIVKENFDYVQGSRFIKGGRWDNLPLFRFIMIKIHALLFTFITGKKCTDALNGFRAFKLSVFKDSRINVWQDWLDRYELEMYLHFKLLKCGYRFKEVPVSKIYPRDLKTVKYTHIKPVLDWWSIIRPLILMGLGLRR
jgi:dolichol-phosphate mannosyltransferase